MMDIYREKLVLRSKDVNMHRLLRTSKLFEMLQEVSIRHTEELGAGRAVTLDRGLLWVVTLQRAEILRMPEYDKEIVVETWPGPTLHILFPRYYRVLDAEGKVLINASALWVLIDSKTRKFVFPEKYGVTIDGATTKKEISLPATPESLETSNSFMFTVPFSYVDLNGHMNNTKYFDLIEDNIPNPISGKVPKLISTEYISEILLHENISVEWGRKDNKYYFVGKSQKDNFKITYEY